MGTLGARKWTQEDLEELKQKYPTCDLEELSKEINRGVRSIVSKASQLGIKKRYNNSVVNGNKFCSYCKRWHPIDEFYRNKHKCEGYEYYCKRYYKDKENSKSVVQKDKYKFHCATEYIGVDRERIVHDRRTVLEFEGIKHKQCNKCEEWIPLIEFAELKGGVGGRTSRCKACHNIEYWHKNEEIEYALRNERMRLRKEEPSLEEKQVQSKAKKIVKAMPQLQEAFKKEKEAKAKAKAKAKAEAEAKLENKDNKGE